MSIWDAFNEALRQVKEAIDPLTLGARSSTESAPSRPFSHDDYEMEHTMAQHGDDTWDSAWEAYGWTGSWNNYGAVSYTHLPLPTNREV